MLINYDNRPRDSLLYTSAALAKYIKLHGFDFDDCYNHFLEMINPNPLLFYYSLDLLYLLGIVSINEKGETSCVY